MGFRKTNMDNMIEVINHHATRDGIEINPNIIDAMREIPRN